MGLTQRIAELEAEVAELHKHLQVQHDQFTALLNVMSARGLITQQEWWNELIRLRRDDPAEET